MTGILKSIIRARGARHSASPTRRAGLCRTAGFGAALCLSWLVALMPSAALACDQDCEDAIDKLSGAALARDQSVAAGRNNSVVLQYGAGIPVLKCRPLNFCSIQLQPGEVPIEDLALGDTVLWSAEVRVSGSTGDPHVRIIIKPDQSATQTSLLIATDKRFYDVQLVNSDTDYTPVMAFTYPAEQAAATRVKITRDQARRNAAQVQVALEETRQSLTVGAAQVFAGDLDFNFTIRGNAPFKPQRVFSDGRKTYIDLPDGYRGEKPVFLTFAAGRAGRGATGGAAGGVVNSRWRGNRLEIDRVIEAGSLILGVGGRARTISIRRARR